MTRRDPMTYGTKGSRAFTSLADFVAPANQAVLDRLPGLPPGSVVVDLACGAGEPGLSVVRRAPGLRLIGVDRSPEMLALARAEAGSDPDVRFVESDLEDLDLASDTADAVVSRFGFLAFEDLTRSVPEFARIARPGCVFSVVVWDRLELNTIAHAVHGALDGLVDDGLLPPLDEQDRRAVEHRQVAALREIGVSTLHTELVSWSSVVDGFDTIWARFVEQGIFAAAVATLDGGGLAELRRRLADRLATHVGPDGSYVIPMTCRALWGQV